jgi:uncharacterized membrane protein
MQQKMLSTIKQLLKPLFAIALVISLTLGHADNAMAARSGGRIGGGSFSIPSRTYSSPSTGYSSSRGYSSGGIGFPFLLPFFGFGGGFGGLFTILIFIGIANFLVNTLRRTGEENNELGYTNNSTISVGRVQVGLLSNARSLQIELDQLAERADTGSAIGRAQILQEASLTLLRHPEYWVYVGAESQQSRLEAAEAKFNQLVLAERSKFTEETLSNVNNQLRQTPAHKSLLSQQNGELVNQTDLSQEVGEYIVVTILVGVEGTLQLPVVKNSEDLRQALRQIGGISSDRLLTVEILWTPQDSSDTLTSDDMLTGYPDLKLV